MADAPNPDGLHEHLFHPHLLAQARQDATRTGSPQQVWCAICRGATTISAEVVTSGLAPRGHLVDRQPVGGHEPVVPQQQRTARGPRQEVSGPVVLAAPTVSRSLVRLRVGDVVVFASRAGGHAEALGAAAVRGDHVRAEVQRVGGDLYVRAVSPL